MTLNGTAHFKVADANAAMALVDAARLRQKPGKWALRFRKAHALHAKRKRQAQRSANDY